MHSRRGSRSRTEGSRRLLFSLAWCLPSVAPATRWWLKHGHGTGAPSGEQRSSPSSLAHGLEWYPPEEGTPLTNLYKDGVWACRSLVIAYLTSFSSCPSSILPPEWYIYDTNVIIILSISNVIAVNTLNLEFKVSLKACQIKYRTLG